MKHIYTFRLMIIMLIAVNAAFAVINYNGDDYVEAFLPLNFSGATSERYVVMSSGAINLNNNNQGSTYINGTLYKGVNQAIPDAADDRYFIYYSPANSRASSTVTGTNDWTTQTHTSINAPYTQTGAGSYFYTTTDPLDSVITSNMDFFLINNADYTNSTVTSLPAKINGAYYFYYGTTNASGTMEVKDYSPKLNVKLFIEGGF